MFLPYSIYYQPSPKHHVYQIRVTRLNHPSILFIMCRREGQSSLHSHYFLCCIWALSEHSIIKVFVISSRKLFYSTWISSYRRTMGATSTGSSCILLFFLPLLIFNHGIAGSRDITVYLLHGASIAGTGPRKLERTQRGQAINIIRDCWIFFLSLRMELPTKKTGGKSVTGNQKVLWPDMALWTSLDDGRN